MCNQSRLALNLLLLGLAWSPLGSAAERPDIVLLLTDQHRYDELSAWGTAGASTPAMDRICQAGVMFTRAMVPTPQCSPTRAAILTGRFPHAAGVVGNVSGRRTVPAGQSPPLDPEIPNLGSVFSQAGYQTAYFGKWHLGGTPATYGFQTVGVVRGRELSLHVADFLRRRQSRSPRRPLLLIVSWLNPHDIYHINRPGTAVDDEIAAELPVSLRDDLTKKPFPQRHFLLEDQGKPFLNYSAEQWRRYVRFYHQLTTQVDAELGRVAGLIREHSASAVTVFTSEHGDLGGAHGLPYKCPAMYDELIRVPLAIMWPGHIEPARSNALVSSIDLLPTLCDLAGVDIPAGVDGLSLRPLLEGKAPADTNWREALFGEYYGKQNWRAPIRMVRTHRWKYVRYTHYGEELYDLRADPAEMNNLADARSAASQKRKLRRMLNDWIRRTNDPFPTWTATDRNGNRVR